MSCSYFLDAAAVAASERARSEARSALESCLAFVQSPGRFSEDERLEICRRASAALKAEQNAEAAARPRPMTTSEFDARRAVRAVRRRLRT